MDKVYRVTIIGHPGIDIVGTEDAAEFIDILKRNGIEVHVRSKS